jgi:hypothetical protein
MRVLPDPVASATSTLPTFSTIQSAWAIPALWDDHRVCPPGATVLR